MSTTTTTPPPPDPPAPTAAPVDPAVLAAQKEAQAAASIGAQIILDYNEDGSKGARGGAGGDIVENTMARDAYLVSLGLDPTAPTGPPPSPELLKARQEAAAKAADPQFLPPASGKATRVSSLAAGISSDDLPPPGGSGGTTPAAPTNTAVPVVTQTGGTLNATQGTWTGSPTSYAYQWQIDGANAGTDAAAYTTVPGDVGKNATVVVTATNATGATPAPASAGVVVT